MLPPNPYTYLSHRGSRFGGADPIRLRLVSAGLRTLSIVRREDFCYKCVVGLALFCPMSYKAELHLTIFN